MAILSIQSHVVYGYAGNTAAVFPMQRLGREVWAINTVEFSNHTGYGAWRGKVLGGELAEELVEGLEDRGVLANCEAVLSGYMGDAAVGRAITKAVEKVKAAAPGALYCCDPVMGDLGRGFYVKPDIPEIFKNELLPIADIISPNRFELGALSGLEVSENMAPLDMDEARRAIDKLHEKGPGIVVVTSFFNDGNHIEMLASDKGGLYSVKTPELPIGVGMAGSGDITTSVFLSRYLETRDVKRSLELCAASIYGIIEKSWRAYSENPNRPKLMELRIIQSQGELEKPSHNFEAKKL